MLLKIYLNITVKSCQIIASYNQIPFFFFFFNNGFALGNTHEWSLDFTVKSQSVSAYLCRAGDDFVNFRWEYTSKEVYLKLWMVEFVHI